MKGKCACACTCCCVYVCVHMCTQMCVCLRAHCPHKCTCTCSGSFWCLLRRGGGFKENDNVEYRQYDSDSEMYDEFGRKKKKFRKKEALSMVQVRMHLHYSVFCMCSFTMRFKCSAHKRTP